MIAVVTTIQEPTDCMRRLATALRGADAPLLVMGDRKGPQSFDVEGAELLTLDDQLASPFELARHLPTDYYTRKNIGYLAAIARGADCIYETDDDNAPAPSWAPRGLAAEARVVDAPPWLNVYRLFTDELIWPRGFPLQRIRESGAPSCGDTPVATVEAPVQQGLVDLSPDVDAVWRLTLDREFRFERRPSVLVPAGTWCPFNSQSTWWWPRAYPLMYLPSHCSFRMTDIWRSFVAQRCLWELGHGLVVHAPEVIQERNVHDLMRDFRDEIPGYTGNEALAERLSELTLASGPDAAADNLVRCYEALVRAGFFPPEELDLVRSWLGDLKGL